MYHVAVDNQMPYWVYTNRQDNGTMRGPSTAPEGATATRGIAAGAGRGGRGGGRGGATATRAAVDGGRAAQIIAAAGRGASAEAAGRGGRGGRGAGADTTGADSTGGGGGGAVAVASADSPRGTMGSAAASRASRCPTPPTEHHLGELLRKRGHALRLIATNARVR